MIKDSDKRVVTKPRQRLLTWVGGAAGLIGILMISMWVLQQTSFPQWTQFEEKGLWDLLELLATLAVPIVLAVFGVWFTRTENERQHKIAEDSRAQERKLAEEAQSQERVLAEKAQEEERRIAKESRDEERRLALDNQQERALQEYMDRMTELLLDKRLRESEEGSEVRAVAHARTHAVLRRLDPDRRTSVVRFLLDAKLIGKGIQIIPLDNANLQGISLRYSWLNEASMEGANLKEAHLYRVRLFQANLSKADLSGANLKDSILTETNFSGANLRGANLEGTKLQGANFKGADLTDAIVTGAIFNNAILTDAKLPPDFPMPQPTASLPPPDKGPAK